MCVEEFDHHCPWIGNCVGKRNYFYFFRFLVSINALSFVAFVVCLSHAADEKANRYDRVASSVLSVAIFVVLFFVVGLLAFHIYLVLTGTTTNEKIKETWPESSFNPFFFATRKINCLAKVKNRKSKPQFNLNAVVEQYQDELNPNLILRNVRVFRRFLGSNGDDSAEQLSKPVSIFKPGISRPESPLKEFI
jgi:hypothetical protein